MKKEERQKWKQQIKLCEKFGAKRFQKVVFGVEKAKFKVLKTIAPNFIEYYDKYCDWKKKKALKRAKTQEEKDMIIQRAQFEKMAMRKDFHQEKDRNYHMDSKKPTEIYQYLEWNKGVHKKGMIKNAILLPIFIGGSIMGVPGALPLAIFELLSAGINFECINIQNYNIGRYKIMEETMKKREARTVKKDIEEFGQDYEVIYSTMKKKEDLPSWDEILQGIRNPEQLKQFREMLLREQSNRVAEKGGVRI